MEYIIKKVSYKNFDITKLILRTSTAIGFVLIALFILFGFYRGIFSSTEAFSTYIIKLGIIAPIIFMILQAVQVIIPILPGGIGCVAGVVAFGPVNGFFYNYIGICLGSIVAFIIAKKYGPDFVKKVTNSTISNKYWNWINAGKRFDTFFAVAIFSPVAPDDLLCFLAGLTKMSFKKFSLIILLCKPFSILIYSLSLTGLLSLFH